MNWTKSQKQAITTKNKSLLLNAGAGCGKTTVLTNRILNLMLEEKVSIENFLVVTFTNNAAAQMKEKIRNMLYDKMAVSEEFIYEQINSLETCNISTLHSFCIETIRKYYHIVDIDPSFNIMDDVNTDMLKNEVMNKLFEKMYEDDNESFIKTSLLYSEKNDEDSFKRELLRIYTFLYDNPYPFEFLKQNIAMYENGNIDKFEEIIKEDIISKLNASLECMEKAYTHALQLNIGDKALDVLEKNFNLIKSATIDIASIDLSMLKDVQNNFGTLTFPKGMEEIDKTYIKTNRDTAKKIFNGVLGVPFFSKEEYKILSKELTSHLKVIYDALLLYDKMLKEEKKKKGVLDFSDTEHLTLEILENEEALEEIRNNFKYVFVDEYQDINSVQEEIITKIAHEDNLFTVGDIKQSIYRFRQANPSIFLDRYKRYNSNEDKNAKCIYMQENFRSNENLIKAINTIFLNLMSENIGGIDYRDNQELIAGKKSIDKNKIEINILDNKNFEAKTYEDELVRLGNEEKEATFVANRILSLINEQIYDEELKGYRNVKLSDICILSRSGNKDIDAIKDVFNKFNIPLNTPVETNFYTSYEIQTIHSLLILINNFKDDINLLSVMRSPIYNFTMDELIEIKLTSKEKYFYNCVLKYEKSEYKNDETLEKINKLIDDLNSWYEKSTYMPVPDLINDIYTKTDLIAFVLALPFGMTRKENLKTMIDLAKNYESFSNDGLYGFLKFIEYNKQTSSEVENSASTNKDSVNYMTIHKSKGLEFPIIILYNAGSNLKQSKKHKKINVFKEKTASRTTKPSILLNKDLGIGINYNKNNYYMQSIQTQAISIIEKREFFSEELRLLYVALTRAKEKVIVTGRIGKKNLTSVLPLIGAKKNNYNILNAASYLEWMLLGCNLEEGTLNNDLFEVNVINETLMPKEHKQPIQIEENGDTEEISSHLSYKYPYVETLIPMKLSVSSLKEEENIRIGQNTIDLIKPSFGRGQEELTLAEKGTLIHFILEIIDLEKIRNAKKIEEEIKRQTNNFIEQKRIDEKDKQYIDMDILASFYKSEIGQGILNSKNVFRELPFTLSVKAKELHKDYKDSHAEILVQGIIDLLYEDKDGNYILVDYKTSHYKNEKDRQKLIDYYSFQLDFYKRAVENITGKQVAYSYIYFLNNKEAVEIK